jgi:hypothetical protein
VGNDVSNRPEKKRPRGQPIRRFRSEFRSSAAVSPNIGLSLCPRSFVPLYPSSLFSSVPISLTPLRPLQDAMAITQEPGQKGVNWSNIAVGEWSAIPAFGHVHVNSGLTDCPGRVSRCYYEHGNATRYLSSLECVANQFKCVSCHLDFSSLYVLPAFKVFYTINTNHIPAGGKLFVKHPTKVTV